uniref:SERPIN domain-containing protein n=1 Tax=Angiostrongylus cantonensis TaxID=6313 RepID=A0A158PBW8_ANGCA
MMIFLYVCRRIQKTLSTTTMYYQMDKHAVNEAISCSGNSACRQGMRTILLFASAAVVTNYAINGTESNGKSFNYDREDVQEISGDKLTTLRMMNHLKSTRRQSEQVFTDGESGARAKRRVLKDNVGLNTTRNGGAFYTFNTSEMKISIMLVAVAVGMNCENSDRTKRQVLSDHFGLNTTWRGAIPYMFNTSG